MQLDKEETLTLASSLEPGLTSGLHGSMNVHGGSLVCARVCTTCIRPFVFYILDVYNLKVIYEVSH